MAMMDISFTIRLKPGMREWLRNVVSEALQMAVDGFSEGQIKRHIRRTIERGLEIKRKR